MRRLTGAVFALLALMPRSAEATQGHKVLTSSWTLTETHWGNVSIAANDVTLDCAGNQIHSSSFAGVNCPSSEKCAIVADGLSGVRVQNCYVVGGAYFQHGLSFKNMRASQVSATKVSNTKSHAFVFEGGGGSNWSQGLSVYGLTATNVKESKIGFLLNGVAFTSGYGLVVQGNTAGHGIRIQNSRNVSLADMTMLLLAGVNATGVGLDVIGSTDILLQSIFSQGNVVREFGSAGVKMRTSTRVSLHDFDIVANEAIGLHLKTMTSTSIDNTSVRDTEDSCGCDTAIEATCTGTTVVNSALGTQCPVVPTGCEP